MESLTTVRRTGSRLALLFDYDGTLSPIVAHPALALLSLGTRRLLDRLASLPNVCVGVLSGRSLSDLRHLVGLPTVYYAGNSGLELDLLGRRMVHPDAERYRRRVASVVSSLGEVSRGYPGAWVEDKGLGLTLHYRDVPLPLLKDLLEQAGRLLHPHAGSLRVVDGPMAWEVTPALPWDKGTALRKIVETAGVPAVPLYVGDRTNDEPALEAANELGGVSIGVGESAPTCARHRLGNPADLLAFLAGLAEALHEVRPGVAWAAVPAALPKRPQSAKRSKSTVRPREVRARG